MRTHLFAISCALLLALALALVGSFPDVAWAAEDGSQLFTTYCSTCHGPAGGGDGPASAGLDPKPANLSDPAFWEGKDDAYLKRVIKEGGAAVGKSPLMVPWAAILSDAQVEAIIAHLKTLKKS